MGCCQTTQDREQKKVSDDIDSQIRADRQKMRTEAKMLLLGAGESGKSTILKQMQLIHGTGYSNEERHAFKEIIFSNAVQSMKVILEAMQTLGIENKLVEEQAYLESVPAQLEGDVMPQEVATSIKKLWKDERVQSCFQRSKEYQLNDSAKYYFDSIDRISASDYLPTDQDILRSRVKTTGIVETMFRIGDLTYRYYCH